MFSKDLFFSGTIKVGSVWLSVNQRETLAANEKFNQSKKKMAISVFVRARLQWGKKEKMLIISNYTDSIPCNHFEKKNESVPGS